LTAHHSGASAHGSASNIWVGSILSILLTVIPFWLVMSGALESATATAATIFVFAMVQIIVHVVCFLHVNSRSEDGWTLLAFIFTAIIVGITIIGTIWVMYHLNANMMPMSVGEMNAM
jgi:cytochrome o ubiquinol oxidase operon protein cyoD